MSIGKGLAPRGITVRAPFPPVTNIKHSNADGLTTISWKKPDTNSKISGYEIIWEGGQQSSDVTSVTLELPKCRDIQVVIYVKYPGQTSQNVTYDLSYIMGESFAQEVYSSS